VCIVAAAAVDFFWCNNNYYLAQLFAFFFPGCLMLRQSHVSLDRLFSPLYKREKGLSGNWCFEVVTTTVYIPFFFPSLSCFFSSLLFLLLYLFGGCL
jgi:hypothetical protein